MLLNVLFRIIFCLSQTLLFLPNGHAELFSNSYISFEMPPNWKCNLDGTEYVCVSKYEKTAKEAIIILTAKEAGPVDSLATYKGHLGQPKSIADAKGNLVPSKVLHLNERTISNHMWIDSLHMGSEISSYYTRYLATVKDRLGIVITFSAHKDHYTKYSQNFIKAIESLRVVASKDILEPRPQLSVQTGQNETIGGAFDIPTEPIPESGVAKNGSGLGNQLIGLALLIAGVGFYLWRKKKGK